MINLGKFSEEKFQSLKSGISGGVKSLGVMGELKIYDDILLRWGC